eukprot:PhF_6_TR6939/c0_g1_i1/m.10177
MTNNSMHAPLQDKVISFVHSLESKSATRTELLSLVEVFNQRKPSGIPLRLSPKSNRVLHEHFVNTLSEHERVEFNDRVTILFDDDTALSAVLLQKELLTIKSQRTKRMRSHSSVTHITTSSARTYKLKGNGENYATACALTRSSNNFEVAVVSRHRPNCLQLLAYTPLQTDDIICIPYFGHTQRIISLKQIHTPSGTSDKLVTTSLDGTLRVWWDLRTDTSTTTRRPPSILTGHVGAVWDCSGTLSELFSIGADRSVRIWDYSNHVMSMVHPGRGGDHQLDFVAIGARDGMACVVDELGQTFACDARSPALQLVLPSCTLIQRPHGVQCVRDRYLLIQYNTFISVIDVRTWKEVQALIPSNDADIRFMLDPLFSSNDHTLTACVRRDGSDCLVKWNVNGDTTEGVNLGQIVYQSSSQKNQLILHARWQMESGCEPSHLSVIESNAN